MTTVTDSRWRTNLSVTIRGHQHPGAAAAQHLLTTLADTLEVAISRFRPDSELSLVNRAPGQWHEITPVFASVLSAALKASEISGGLADPTLGHLVDQAGYRIWRDGASAREVPSARSTQDAKVTTSRMETGWQAETSWRAVELRPTQTGAHLRIPPGLQLDLGALGKAWLADRVAEMAVHMWNVDVMANMGGDLRAIGDAEPWLVGSDPEIAGFVPAALLVTEPALATSGQGKRRWKTEAGLAHHIIDPRTGWSAESRWWTVSVLADSAVAANTAATTALILDADGPKWLRDRGYDAWLVQWDGSPNTNPQTVATGMWPKDCQVAQ